mmetsp:Transcript_49751/g.127994  ORF Transcript_49751/g.127994 Transcript_49751/m.127994 type:complete len:221 (-) Transcript_49751:359-1021(-)
MNSLHRDGTQFCTHLLLFADTLKERVCFQHLFHPIMQLFHIRRSVDPPSLLKNERILAQQCQCDNSSSVVLLLELRVRKEEEKGFQLAFVKEVGDMLLCIRPHNGGIVEQAVMLLPHADDPLPHISAHLVSDLHPQAQRGREGLCKVDQQPTISTSDISVFNHFAAFFAAREVRLPVNRVGRKRVWERDIRQNIAMSSHSKVLPSRPQVLCHISLPLPFQ